MMKTWHVALIGGILLLVIVVAIVSSPKSPSAVQAPVKPNNLDGFAKLGNSLVNLFGDKKVEAPSPGYVKPGTSYVIPSGTTPEDIASYNKPETTGQQVYGIAGIDYPL